VIVLDEATSALDGSTESEVMDAIHALRGSKTVIIVAHRLSTVESCDRIFRMEDGRLVESGPPGEILRKLATHSSKPQLDLGLTA
jgi:ABC-type bacteriocin/lantibiotic exporter with double-glycine peptidase domain